MPLTSANVFLSSLPMALSRRLRSLLTNPGAPLANLGAVGSSGHSRSVLTNETTGHMHGSGGGTLRSDAKVSLLASATSGYKLRQLAGYPRPEFAEPRGGQAGPVGGLTAALPAVHRRTALPGTLNRAGAHRARPGAHRPVS